ncbi:T9SS type A sorting domain-containing protein [Chryseobacterium sp.]|uniref:T9SS type A sorting domain-containing protein n=1 Tax=Chryseobacterium sp. TaxID=1871047 RepID=UPI00289BEC8B|nr:T9SS type A sorting domain-containing protein [Chryseobacterium sp.]
MKKIFTILGIAAISTVVQAQQNFNYVFANQGFTNGQVLSTGDIVTGKLTYTVLQNGSTTEPAYYTNGTNMRLYSQTTSGDGNSYAIQGATSVKMTSVKIVTSNNNYAPSTAIITVDGVVVPTVYDPADTTNSTYLITSATGASNVKIQNGQTGTSAQIRMISINITYNDSNLAVADFNKSKSNFVKNTFVKNDEVTFGEDAKDVKVYTLTGQLLKTTSVKANETVNVADLPKGSYLVTGTVNNQPVSQKILKD